MAAKTNLIIDYGAIRHPWPNKKVKCRSGEGIFGEEDRMQYNPSDDGAFTWKRMKLVGN